VPDAERFIVSAGTQVVARVQTSGAAALRPRGAVAVIVESPLDRTHAYRVRFVDGGEASLRRSEFAIRKQHQVDGLGAAPDEAFATFEPYIVLRSVVGSRAYGLDEEGSDTDRRGIFLPSAPQHWSLAGVPEQIERDDTQETYWELEKAILLALKANPTVLELLYSPLVETVLAPADELLRERHRFVSRLVYQTYNGYVLSQFKKLQGDLRTTGEVRWKHVMHLLRLLLAGIEVLRDGQIPLDVGPHRDRLIAVRRGEVPWADVEEWRRDLHREFDNAYRETTLPERPDYAWADDFLIRARRQMVER
jgi:uncharacterized protein